MLTHRRTGQTSGSKKEDGKKQTQSEKARKRESENRIGNKRKSCEDEEGEEGEDENDGGRWCSVLV